MYRYNEITEIHMEISSRCQARCPMCSRNIHGGLVNPLLKETDISLTDFKSFICADLLKQINKLLFCGNYGDPLLNNDFLEIMDYSVSQNPNIQIDIHTNGSLRNKQWWKKLAETLPKNHLVNFAIDGLSNTHSIYRIGTDFEKIIDNAKAFIKHGGNARWVYLTFKHNEHQIDQARALAKEIGFKSFYEKQTKRFIGSNKFDVLDKDLNFLYNLESPTEQKLIIVDETHIKNWKEILSNAKIECEVKKSKSIYIDSSGYVWPCCYVGLVPYQYYQTKQLAVDYMVSNKEQLDRVIDLFGGLDSLDLRNRSIKDVVASKAWQTIWQQEFENNSLPVCSRTCGKFENKILSANREQFLKLREFNE